MTRQVLNRGTIANDGTGDTLRTASLKIEQNFQEIYNKLGDGNVLMSLLDFDSDAIVFEGATQSSFETRLRAENPSADNDVTIPNHTGVLTMDTNTQTLTNKTLTSPVLTTPQINDSSANHQYIFAVNALSANRTITLPLLTGDDEFTFNSHTQTLSNKTLQAPQINNPRIGSFIYDSSGNELLHLQDSSSAIGFLRVGNSTSGNPVRVQAAGEANTSLSLRGTGNGAIKVDSKLALKTQGLSGAGSINVNVPVTQLTATTGTPAHTIPDGTTSLNGEIKYIVNSGSVVNTVAQTGSNIRNGSTITIQPFGAVTLIWFSSQWSVIYTYNATLA